MSENFEIDIKSFFINLPKTDSYFDILISSPSPIQKKTLGKLIILTKIDSTVQTKNLANIINENIRSNYYSNLNANVEFAIESTLVDFNKKIKEIEKIERIKDFEKAFSSIVIIIKNGDIYFTQHGEFDSILIHKGKLINIGEENQTENSTIFSDIVIGKIYKNNVLLFASKSLFKHVSAEKIVNHLEGSNVESTKEFIEKSLDAGNNIKESLGFMMVGENKIIEEQIFHEEKPVELEEKNEEDIISKITPEIKNGLGFLKIVKDNVAALYKKISNSQNLKNFFNSIKNLFKKLFNKIGTASKNAIKKINKEKISKTFKELPQVTINKAKTIKEDIEHEPIKQRISNFIKNSKKWFEELEKSKKILFISIVSLIFILIFIFRIYQSNKAVKLEDSQYQSSVNAIESLQNEASSVLMYNNVSRATDLISEAEYLINKLKVDSKTRRDVKEKLLADNKNVLNKVFKVTNIVNPTIFNDFSSLNTESQVVNINKILSINEKLFAFDYKNKNIYEFDKTNIKKVLIDNTTLGEFTACNNSTTENGNILIFDSNKKLYLFDGIKLTNIDVGDKLKNLTISDFSSYSTSLYLIDKTNKKMLTMKKTANKYGSTYSWLKDTFDFTNFSSISIDGYIYLSDSTGNIQRFLRGYNKAFTLDQINPKLDNIDKIYTNENIDYLYALDSKQKRVVIFNKNTNSLVSQFASESFDKLNDFIIDTTNNKSYLLNNNKVFETTLN